MPRSVADLEQHRAILYTNRATDWRFPRKGGDIIVRPHAVLRVDNGLMMRDAAVSGLGITLLPTFMIHAERKAGMLQVVDVGAEAERAEIHVAYPRAQRPSAMLRALVKHLRLAFGSPPYWEVM